VAIDRVFRGLDKDKNQVLGFEEHRFLFQEILKEEFTRSGFDYSIQMLKKKVEKKGDCYVSQQGTTLQGLKVLILEMAHQKKWEDIWTILRYFNFGDDLKLEPRWSIPELADDQVIELLPKTFKFLEEVFKAYSCQKEGKKVIENDTIANLLNVLPGESMISSILNFNMLETDNDLDSPSLTLDGWLSFWAFLANEKRAEMLPHLDYLISTSETASPGEWFRICPARSGEGTKKYSERNFIRALVLSDCEAGKSTFCCKLIRSWAMARRRTPKTTEEFSEIYCNRIRDIPDYPYCFLSLEEVQSNQRSLNTAIQLLPSYDLVVLAYDLSNKRSFEVLEELFTVVMKYNTADLPVQVLGLKHDIKQASSWVEEVPEKLKKELCVFPQQCVSAKHQNLTQLYKGLLLLGKMPEAGRVWSRQQTGILSYAKRTMSISMLGFVVYGLYRLYQRQTGVNEVSNSFSVPNPLPPIKTPELGKVTESAVMTVVDAISTRQGKQL
jgi:GTPase SAR1 family protein